MKNVKSILKLIAYALGPICITIIIGSGITSGNIPLAVMSGIIFLYIIFVENEHRTALKKLSDENKTLWTVIKFMYKMQGVPEEKRTGIELLRTTYNVYELAKKDEAEQEENS